MLSGNLSFKKEDMTSLKSRYVFLSYSEFLLKSIGIEKKVKRLDKQGD